MAAQPGDEIRVAGGIYRPDHGVLETPGDRTATFALKSGVVLLGGFAGCGEPNPDLRDWTLHETILSGDLLGNDGSDFSNYADNSYHVVTYADPMAQGTVLDGFTVCCGNADGTGPSELTTNQGSGIHIRNGALPCMPGGPQVRNCTIRDNWSLHHGAVNDHAFGTLIDNCIFEDNHADMEGAALQIHTGSPTVRNSVFRNNVSGGNGGGVWTGEDQSWQCESPPSHPTFEGCLFEGNIAGIGGGFYADTGSNPTLTQCTFRGNSATQNGGGMYTFAHVVLNMTDCLFEDNYAAAEGGGLYAYTKGGLLERVTVRNNRAGQYGGGAEVSTAEFGSCGGICPETTWRNCLFENNEATSGGGIHSHYRTVHNFDEVHFRNNRSTVWAGGGFYLTGQDTTVRLTDCTFLDNLSESVGGGMYIWHEADVQMVRTHFLGNRAKSSGAGLEVFSGSNVQVINSRFIGNRLNVGTSSTRAGGAIRVVQSDLMAVNSIFAGNQAVQGAGASAGTDGNIQLIHCTMVHNTASGAGGGAHLSGGNVTIHNSILWGNIAAPQFGQQIHTAQGIATAHVNVVQGGWPGDNNLDMYPQFVDSPGPDGITGTTDDDFQLRTNSPAIDAGNDTFLPADAADLDGNGDTNEPIPYDYVGQLRIVGAAPDLGAFEQSDSCEPPCGVPAVSEWGVLILILLIVVSGTILTRSRNATICN